MSQIWLFQEHASSLSRKVSKAITPRCQCWDSWPRRVVVVFAIEATSGKIASDITELVSFTEMLQKPDRVR
jgi:hypothetical protein